MAETFNPYRQWLDLSTDEPASDYELLGLPPFEGDATVIALAADKAIARVRSNRPGEHAARWSRLLDDLATAKRRLLDATQRAQYDDQLRAGTLPKRQESTPATPANPSTNGAVADYRYPPGTNGGLPANAWAAVSTPDSTPVTAESVAPAPEVAPASQPATAAPWASAAAPPWQATQPQLQPQMLTMPGAPMQGAPMGGMPMNNLGMPMAYAMPVQPGHAPGYAALMMPGMAMPQQPMMPGAYPYMQPQQPTGWYAPQPTPPSPPPPLADAMPMAQPWNSPAPTGIIDPMAPVSAGNSVDPMAAAVHVPGGGPVDSQLPMGKAVSIAAAATTEAPLTVSGQSAKHATAARSRASGNGPMLAVGGLAAAGLLAVIVWAAVGQGDAPTEVAESAGERKPIVRPEPRREPPVRPVEPIRKPTPPKIDPAVDPVMGTLLPPKEKPLEPKPVDPMPKPPEPAPEPTPTPIPTPPEPEPKPPEPKPEPAKPLPTKEEVSSLAKALQTARLALSEGNIEVAKSQLDSVAKLNKLPEHEAMYERLGMLADYNGQFWDAVKEGTKGFESGSELAVGSTVITVVEVLPDDKIILRIAGKNQTFPLKDLKAGIAMAIAEKWFKPNDPTALVMKGAYAAVNKAGNIERAKEWWGEAIAGGVDVKSLLPVIDDQYGAFEQDLDKAVAAREAK